jgi:hypothetical protein
LDTNIDQRLGNWRFLKMGKSFFHMGIAYPSCALAACTTASAVMPKLAYTSW